MDRSAVTANDPLDPAISYAARGWAVIPLYGIRDGRCACSDPNCTKNVGKHPRIKDWVAQASTDSEVIREWWRRWPDSNVGIVTGGRSRIVVLDIDPRNGGDESLDRLVREHGPLPETVESLTGGGGRHLLFQDPGLPVRKRIGLLPGIDLCAEGAQIVAPPSAHRSGRSYAWDLAHHPDDTPLAPAPRWLVDLTRKAAQKSAASPGDATSKIPAGRRDTFMISLGGLLRRHGLEEGAIHSVLSHANETVIEQPPDDQYTEGDVAAKAKSAARYPPATAAKPTREIVVRNELKEVVQEAESALVADENAGIYTRGGILAKVVRDGARKLKGLIRPSGAPVIVPAEIAWVRERLDHSAAWVKETIHARTGEVKRAQALPPKWVAETLMARGEWPFPPLEGVVETPVFRPDGSILLTPGYDPETGLIYDPGDALFPPIPDRPTIQDAARAIVELLEPFAEFDFVAEADRSAGAAAVLTIIGRHAIQGPVPIFAFRAPTPGSGKSLLADAISQLGTGRAASKMAPPTSDEETKKLILALGIEGAAVVLIDNANGVFGSNSLAAALTANTWSDRLLGVSKTLTVVLRMTWLLTGNNVSFKGDLGRRVIPCDLDPGVEHPEDRDGFTHENLLSYIIPARPRLVAAALTLLRAYHVAGRPNHGLPAKGSFEAWDSLIRGTLCWIGAEDPLGATARIRDEGDADLDALRQGLFAWRETFGDDAITAAEAIEKAGSTQGLAAALAALAGGSVSQLDAKRLGYGLRKIKGRVVSGLKFESGDPTRTGAKRWKVVGDRIESGPVCR